MGRSGGSVDRLDNGGEGCGVYSGHLDHQLPRTGEETKQLSGPQCPLPLRIRCHSAGGGALHFPALHCNLPRASGGS